MGKRGLILRSLLTALGLTLGIAACATRAPATAPTRVSDARPSPPSATPAALASATTAATQTAVPSATLVPTPPALPPAFKTALLNRLGTPHSYVQDTCQYLLEKWTTSNSAPGTVVLAVMFHSITDGRITTASQISKADFEALMRALHDKGFQAITTAQAADFMEQNARIPPRSVLLIADDRHERAFFDKYFRPYWNQYQWPVVNAWISMPLDTLWPQQVDLEREGWVDHQAHGVVHNVPMGANASDAYITSELQGSIDAFKKHFNKTPIAIIWPGGVFSRRATQIAGQLGYRLGFTTAPRGPFMFNWVPLADAADPAHPGWPQEGFVNDPLLVLPRYWDTDAIIHLDTVVRIGQDAAAYAQTNKATELEYYNIVCAPRSGPIP